MAGRFDYFVLFAEMRTGSNFLERNLSALSDVEMFGEAFNPDFVGNRKDNSLFGIGLDERGADPGRLLTSIREAPAPIPGFRFFFDHDPRILGEVLADPRCAKVILTRNPLDSYISIKQASQTDVWILTDATHNKTAKAHFHRPQFEQHLSDLQNFQIHIQHALQTTGQTAFHIHYDDINDVEVLNGLAAFLGSEDRLEELNTDLKPQNVQTMRDKVWNYDEMVSDLAQIDPFNLGRTPNFEPRRGPVVPTYFAAPETPLLYLPIRGGPLSGVLDWMASLDDRSASALETGFTQKSLREWMRHRPGHRRFTILRHPLERAHSAFCTYILATDTGAYGDIRERLRLQYDVPLPEGAPDKSYGKNAHRRAFKAFLKFLKGNLAGQTSVRVDPAWASQTMVLRGMAEYLLPDALIRESDLGTAMPSLAASLGRGVVPYPSEKGGNSLLLERIFDDDLEELAQDAYQRDYINLGFTSWR